MDVRELLECDPSHGQIDGLDTAPPIPLLITLAGRTGIALDRLRELLSDGEHRRRVYRSKRARR
jgi:hypothetical protein